MLTLIYFWIALYLVMIFTPSMFLIGRIGLIAPMGPRDNLPPPERLHGRAERALANFKENAPFFLVPAVLSFAIPETNQDLATQGAVIFLVARAAYLPLYMVGIAMLRSLAWMVSLAGAAMMLWALAG